MNDQTPPLAKVDDVREVTVFDASNNPTDAYQVQFTVLGTVPASITVPKTDFQSDKVNALVAAHAREVAAVLQHVVAADGAATQNVPNLDTFTTSGAD